LHSSSWWSWPQGWAEVGSLHAAFCFFMKTAAEERQHSQKECSFSCVCSYLRSCCCGSTGFKCFCGHQLRARFRSCALKQASPSYWKEIREQDEEEKKDTEIVKDGWRGRSEQEGRGTVALSSGHHSVRVQHRPKKDPGSARDSGEEPGDGDKVLRGFSSFASQPSPGALRSRDPEVSLNSDVPISHSPVLHCLWPENWPWVVSEGLWVWAHPVCLSHLLKTWFFNTCWIQFLSL